MRHRVKGRKLKRTASHRLALLRNLSASLIKHKRIRTTLAKAKELRSFFEPLITKARKGDLHNMKLVMDVLKDKDAGKELFGKVVAQIGERAGGYTRVIKLGRRHGDNAEMAIIELVDYNEVANLKAAANKEERESKKSAKAEKAKKQADEANVISETADEKK